MHLQRFWRYITSISLQIHMYQNVTLFFSPNCPITKCEKKCRLWLYKYASFLPKGIVGVYFSNILSTNEGNDRWHNRSPLHTDIDQDIRHSLDQQLRYVALVKSSNIKSANLWQLSVTVVYLQQRLPDFDNGWHDIVPPISTQHSSGAHNRHIK